MSIVSIPYTFTNGLPLDATQINANFQALAGGLGSGLANAALTNITATSLTLGTISYADTGVVYGAQASLNGYVQDVVQNTNAGAAASADYIVSNNLGTAGTYYGDFGMNSSTFSGTGSLSLPNATYLYSANGDLVVGTFTTNAIHFVVGNGATDAAGIDVNGNFTARVTAALTNAGQRTLQAKLGDIASVTDFPGVDPTGATDSTAGLALARAWLAAATAPAILLFPQGVYSYSTSPNWAIQDASIVSMGTVTLRYTGTGNAVILDAGSGSQTVFNVRMDYFIVQAPSTALNGVYVRSVHHSTLGFNVRGAGSTYSGLRVEFAVCTKFPKYTCSSTDQGGAWYLSSPPQYGMWLDIRNAGETVSYCIFDNPILEHLNTGAYLNNALGNQFYGGTMESCSNIGANLQAGALENKFFGTDFEANTNYDVYCAGYDNEFYGLDSLSQTTLVSGATRNRFFGGSFQSISCLSGSTKNLFNGATWNRLNTSGTITDAGTSNSFVACSSPSSTYVGRPPSRTVLTVGGSPYTYTNTTGDTQKVLIFGGTVSGLVFVHGGVGDSINYNSGVLYPLNAGDALIVTYSVAPTMIAYL